MKITINHPLAQILLLVFAGLLSAVSSRVAEASEPIVRMSPFEVSANSAAFEHWLKIGSPHFTVYTDASPEDAARVLREFEMLHVAMQRYLRRDSYRRPPTIVILPTSRSDWRKVESGAKVEWRVAVSQPTHRAVELIVVQYDWQGILAGFGTVRAAQALAELHGMNLEGPLWFTQGMGRFFETAKFDDDTVTLGKLHTRARTMWLRGWLPWPNVFRAMTSSPEFAKASETVKFSGQSTAFVHYLLTNPEPVWLDRLMNWVALQQAGREPTEEEFKRVFGQDWTDWEKTMKRHAGDRRENVATFRLTAEEMNFPRTRFDLPVREMRELFVLAQILNQRGPVAEAALDVLLEKGLRTEELRELLAEACLKLRRRDAALVQLRALIAAGSTNPGVYALAAEAAFRAQVPEVTIHSRLGENEVAVESAAWCRKALELEPRHPTANNLLAWHVALGPEVKAESLRTIQTCYQALNGRTSTADVVTAWAVAHWRMGNVDSARALASRLATSPYADTRAKKLASAVLQELPQNPVIPATKPD